MQLRRVMIRWNFILKIPQVSYSPKTQFLNFERSLQISIHRKFNSTKRTIARERKFLKTQRSETTIPRKCMLCRNIKGINRTNVQIMSTAIISAERNIITRKTNQNIIMFRQVLLAIKEIYEINYKSAELICSLDYNNTNLWHILYCVYYVLYSICNKNMLRI